jgi:hypothetical protein
VEYLCNKAYALKSPVVAAAWSEEDIVVKELVFIVAILILAGLVLAQVFFPGNAIQRDQDGFLIQDEDEEAGKSWSPEEVQIYMGDDVKDAISRGLEWICSMQGRMGDWPESEWSLCVSSLAGLALASNCHPGKGKYNCTLRKYTDFILSSISRRGMIYCRSNTRPALGHGFSMVFLTQVYGMFDERRNEKIRETIKNGIKYILTYQTREGGWFQDYSGSASHYWIITVSQIQALRAARACGFVVPKTKIKRAIKFVQNRHW